MQIKSYEETVNYLESFIGKSIYRIDLEFLKHHDPLERTRTLLSLLGNPQDKFASVLIGGTAGKGSTAYLISHILTTAGYKTGLTISPHLQKINERIQINNQQISDAKFVEVVNSIVGYSELMKKTDVGAPSYFEILIAMAFKYFCDQKVDIAVVEVGMGGEYDATNILYPKVSVLTNVSLDHTNILGGTVRKIAKTKVGIIKKLKVEKGKLKNISQFSILNSQPMVISGVKQPSVIKIIEDKCKYVGAKLYRLGKDFKFDIKKENLSGSVFDTIFLGDRLKKLCDLRISLLGKHQVENASLAIETVMQLKRFGINASQTNIRKALKTAFFPGRFEILHFEGSPHPFTEGAEITHENFLVRNAKQRPSLSPTANPASANSENFVDSPRQKILVRGEARPFNYTLILDGAHNPAKMKAFLSTLKKLYPKNPKIFVIAFKSDKNIKVMLRQILKLADKIIITEFHVATDMNKNASADALNIKYSKEIIVEKDSKKALDKALSLSTIRQFNNPAIIVVTGSLYLVGEVRNML